ncbi:hypothetical protein [Blastococcus brunescens]|uniref:Signal peptidase I n=1 Tax=Blastococcus brunescens TaxID=1564165 RepID=A0ABZ1AZJ3_9ACTN|nr:hypothetical protein [Blastococcus sp. BMG 8361]WRL63990.1 hypothetical protein U6N30_31085 [Blastococcus sp. BMG 8361]
MLTSAGSYSVGDVVAYRSESLDTIVMHRIVDGDADGFVTQGDNNDWLDEDHPTEEQILGRLFFSIPQGGAVLGALRSPGVLLALIVAAASVVGATAKPPCGTTSGRCAVASPAPPCRPGPERRCRRCPARPSRRRPAERPR